MPARLVLIISLAAASVGVSSAARISADEGTLALAGAAQQIDPKTVDKMPKLMSAGFSLGIALTTALSEAEPKVEEALQSLDEHGWTIVKWLLEGNSKDVQAAKSAWDETFKDDLPEIVKKCMDFYKTGNKQAGLEAVLNITEKSLNAVAAADPAESKHITALAELVHGLGGTVMTFVREMDLLSTGASLAQVGDGLQVKGLDAATANKLMTTVFEMLSAFYASATEDPPDFETLFGSFKLQGWRLVKLTMSKDEQAKPGFKKAKEVWTDVFENHMPELSGKAYDAYKSGATDKTVDVVVSTVTAGLRTASKMDEAQERKFNAVADLIDGISESLMKFAKDFGWLNK